MYKFATGFDNEGSLATITPQPATTGIKPGRVTESLARHVFEDGIQYVELVYNALSNDQYGALLSTFGLTTARSVEATMSFPDNDDRDTFSNYNVILQRLEEPKYVKGFWEDAVFKAKIIEAL